MREILTIGIAYDTSQLLTGARQVTDALRQVEQADKSAQTATKALEQSSTQAAQAMSQEKTAASAAASSTQQLAQASGQAASALHQTASAAAGAAQATGQVGQQANTASGFLANLASQALAFGAAQLGIQGVAAAFNTVKEAVSGAVQATLRLETMTATFKAVSGSSQAASADLGFLRQTAERLGISFTDSAKGFQTMAAAAQNTRLAGQGVRDIYTAIAEKGRVLGLSAQEIQGAMLAVSQSFSKGVIQAEELRGQFAERMPGAINEMARALGVGTAELDKMMERGQLGIDAWQKWAQVVRQDLAGATQEAAKTAGAAIERLGNAMRDLQVAVGQYIVPALTTTVGWLTKVVQWSTAAANALRGVDEARDKAAQKAAAVASKGEPGAPRAYADLIAEAEKYDKLAARMRTPVGALLTPSGGYTAEDYERTAKELRADAAELLATTKAIGDEDKRRQTASAIESTTLQQRKTFLEGAGKLLEQQRKDQEAMTSATRTGLGRDPTAEEKVKLQEKQLKDAQEFLQTNSKLAEQFKDDPVVKALRERGQATESASKALDDATKADKDAKRDAKAAEQEQLRLDKERRQQVMATGKLTLEGYEKEGEFIAQLHERVRQLTMTEEERLALQVAAIEDPALRSYAEELLKQVEVAKDFNDQLRERNKLLGEQATASKAKLDDLNRLMQQFEPRRRGESTEERLTRSYTTLSQAPGVTGLQLTQASEKMQALLDAEEWQRWEEIGLSSLEKVGDAITQFAFHGKLTFKDMAASIAEDLFRMSMQTVMGAATKKGGWLEMGLNLGLQVLGLAGGATSGTLPTTEAAYAAQAAAGRFSGRQGGGPVQAGRPYWVGEAGPELIVPRMTGTVVPQGQTGGGVTVNHHWHITTPDATSFVQSRGAVQRMVAQSVSASYRAL